MRSKLVILLFIKVFIFPLLFGGDLTNILRENDQYLLKNFSAINQEYLNKGFHPELIDLNKRVIKIARTKGDSLNVGRALYNIGIQYREKHDYDESKSYLWQAIKIFQEEENYLNIVISHNSLFLIYDNLNEREKAENSVFQAEKLLSKIDSKHEQIRTYDNLSNHYKDIKDYDKSIEYQNKALLLARKHDFTTDIAASYLELGGIYLDKDEYDKSWENYSKAMEYLPLIGDQMFAAYLYNNISALFNKQKKYNLAYEYAIKSIEIKEKLGKDGALAKSYQNLGAIYFFAENYNLAIDSFKKSIALADSLKDIQTLAGCYLNLAVVYNKIDNYNFAIETYDKLLILCEVHDIESTKYSAYGNLAIVYQNIGDNLKSIEYSLKSLENPNKNERSIARNYINIATSYSNLEEWDKAIVYAERANRISYEFNEIRYIVKTNNILAASYAKLNKHQQAYDSLKVYAMLLEQISEEDKENSLEELRIKYETEKKDNIIKELELDKQLTKLQVKQLNYQRLLALIALIIIIFISLQRFFTQKKIIRIKEELNQELETRVKEETNKRMEHQRAIVEQSRLVSLGELAAGIAHELNQPLQCISFALENMKLNFQKKGFSEDYFFERIGLIFHDIERMSSVIDHIRVFSRKQTQNEFTQFELNATIHNASKLILEQYANHSIEMNIQSDVDQAWVYGNTYQIEQVILNLFTNAKDALENNIGEKMIKLILSEDADNFILLIENNGEEIPNDIKEKLFLPFFTTKPAGKGTGLGLSIVYGIITEHNGTIFLLETKKTTFKITLPKIKEDLNE
ncbi:tetratricopeptide repeat protein [bacterium]|nr:tetratricopeptide repeat protein [bacterium]